MRCPDTSSLTRRLPRRLPLEASLTLTLALAACGGGASSSATSSAGGAASGGAGAGAGSLVGGEGGGPLIDEDDACATGAVVGETVPVTMFLVFDKSGSMLDDQKWAGAKAALTAFFQDDESAGLRVALRFFPDDAPVPGCDEQACSVDACAVPLVDVGELTPAPASSDPQQKALVEAIDAVTPSGETPMFPALAGAAKWATEHATPGEKMVVVLVTDGEPNGCNEDMDAIAGVAADALASAGVLTYAIGMSGSSPEQMNQLAVAGGTGASLVIGGGSVHTALLAALSDIKTAELSCTLALPSPEVAGAEVDPTLVNVNYEPAGGGEAVTLGQVADAAACGPTGGWHYDHPSAPTSIELCPSTCAAVQADKGATLRVLLGCATIAN
jgi:hypothetical protein